MGCIWGEDEKQEDRLTEEAMIGSEATNGVPESISLPEREVRWDAAPDVARAPHEGEEVGS
jgi:hypothetical protein